MLFRLQLFLHVFGTLKCIKGCEFHCPNGGKVCRCTDPFPNPKSITGLFSESKSQLPCYDGYVYSCSIDGKCKQCPTGKKYISGLAIAIT